MKYALLFFSVLVATTSQHAADAATPPEPILDGHRADPDIRVFGDTYYVYPTSDKPHWQTTDFSTWSSKDLIHWKNEGIILDVAHDLKWANIKAWAPTATEHHGKYYFYFVANDQIGVATADQPTGPFKDALGKPLITRKQFKTYPIDPFVFTDTDGQPYLYFGNNRLLVVKLGQDMVSLDGEPKDLTPADPAQPFREGVVVFKRKGLYYFMWSVDDANSDNYRVAYGTSKSPFGPIQIPANNLVLAKNGPAKGTGHNGVVNVPGTDRWYVAYHRHAIPDGSGYIRQVCLARMEFNPDGSIKPMDPMVPAFPDGSVGEPITPSPESAIAPSAADDGFLFVTFRNESGLMAEQIHFAVSQDGRNWQGLNDGKPVLVSTVGDRGVRDPYLLRTANGRGFVLLATDLCINRDGNWGRAVQRGSQSIVIWTSTDLVHWSEPRLVKVGVDDAGCVWAPEAVYDPASRRYLVYWASTTKRDHFAKQRIWAAWTNDFKTFSDPFIYIEKPTTVIDTDIVRGGDGNYYRFTKDEKFSAITMETSTRLDGDWTDVPGFSLAQLRGYEGPECYLVEPAAAGKPATWCLILDQYSKGTGYHPYITHDLAGGQFTPGAGFSFPFTFRHGSVLPVSAEEYTRLETAYRPAK